jgi:hypothetical protein
VALRGSGARAEESHRRQAGEGVETGVEVDVEVQGTRAELVAMPAMLEDGWRRPTPAMQSQGRKKTASSGTDGKQRCPVALHDTIRQQLEGGVTPWPDAAGTGEAASEVEEDGAGLLQDGLRGGLTHE